MLLLNLCSLATLPTVTTYNVKPMVLFYTGGNSYMPRYIYSSFLNKMSNKFNINVINYENSLLSVYELTTLHPNAEFIAIGHSSGCTTLVNDCSKHPNIKKCVLLDPVDNNVDHDLKQTPDFEHVLRINAEKSYRWKFTPFPKVPFIPAFKMDTSKFNKITNVNLKDYGHCDILDEPFSNFMHNTVAEGCDDRTSITIYQDFIVDIVDNFIKNDDLDQLIDYNINYKIK